MMEQCLLSFFVQNDQLVSACDFNPWLLTEGAGIYEVIRVIEGKPLFFEEHIERFCRSAKNEKFKLPCSEVDIKSKIQLLISQNRMLTGNIRFQFIQHPHKGGLFLAWATTFYYPGKTELLEGIKMKSLNATRENPHTKRSNMPFRQMADKMISAQIAPEVLLLSDDGLVTEGSRSNIFFIRNTQLFTPPVSLVLEGITRKKIMSAARQSHIRVSEEMIYFSELIRFDSCFISSTSKSVLQVNQIDDIHFKVNDPLTIKLSAAYNTLVKKYLQEFKW